MARLLLLLVLLTGCGRTPTAPSYKDCSPILSAIIPWADSTGKIIRVDTILNTMKVCR